jgi:hypothetical protein
VTDCPVLNQAEVYALTLRIYRLFKKSVSTSKPPGETNCYRVAQLLANLKVSRWKQQRPGERSRISAVKSVRRFKKEVEQYAATTGNAEYHTIKCVIDDWLQMTEGRLIPVLFSEPRDEILAVAKAAQEAWGRRMVGSLPALRSGMGR